MSRSYLGGRLSATRETALLAIGDLAALLVFAAAGEASHGGTLAATFETAGQFGVGWYLVAILGGAYGPRAVDGWQRASLFGAASWVVAAVVGALVRVATEPGAGISPVFLLVTAAVGAVIFGAWRGVAARWLSSGAARAPEPA